MIFTTTAAVSLRVLFNLFLCSGQDLLSWGLIDVWSVASRHGPVDPMVYKMFDSTYWNDSLRGIRPQCIQSPLIEQGEISHQDNQQSQYQDQENGHWRWAEVLGTQISKPINSEKRIDYTDLLNLVVQVSGQI